MILIATDARKSAPFEIQHQITVFASGLQGSDTVEFDVVSITKSAPASGDACCPGQVGLPDINSVNSLKTCAGTAVKLTASKPWLVIDMPQKVPLVARVVADDDAVIEVQLFETDSRGIVCV